MGIQKVGAGVMAVVFNETADSILLHHRTDNHLWSLPGGSLEFGETLHDSVIREVKEETGLIVIPRSLIGVYSDPKEFIFSYPDGNEVHAVVVAFRCAAVAGTMIQKNEESNAVGWFKTNALPDDIWRMQKIVIADALKNSSPVLR